MACARDGDTKVSNQLVRRPLLNINRACQTGHKVSEDEIRARVDTIQTRNFELMQRGGVAIVALIDAINAAKKEGAKPEQLFAALEPQRQAQWRPDCWTSSRPRTPRASTRRKKRRCCWARRFDYTRRGELAATRWRTPQGAVAAAAVHAPAAASAARPHRPPGRPRSPVAGFAAAARHRRGGVGDECQQRERRKRQRAQAPPQR